MTPKTIHLNKLLKLLQLQDRQLTSALRGELRSERDKIEGLKEGGGDFHGPFWSDAKLHVIGAVDLRKRTQLRIEASKQRRRLYPLLEKGFLDWLEDVKRGTNQTVGWHEAKVHNHHPFPDLALTVKVDNVLALTVGADHYRLVYPYFSETPVLSERWARVGLWVMAEALPRHDLIDMEIVDILRGRGFRGSRLFLKGDEEALFAGRYSAVLREWDKLRSEYDLS